MHFPDMDCPHRIQTNWDRYKAPTTAIELGKEIEKGPAGKHHRTRDTRLDEIPGFDMVRQFPQ